MSIAKTGEEVVMRCIPYRIAYVKANPPKLIQINLFRKETINVIREIAKHHASNSVAMLFSFLFGSCFVIGSKWDNCMDAFDRWSSSG